VLTVSSWRGGHGEPVSRRP